ncbi:MAG: hypothetical protein HQL13_01435 [Candidatus Omnitrophica bacterium]|nr:hypothetical protein [Candidatus Omnitrophota bacterium]
MQIYPDYCGQNIRLTDERQKHIFEHPEMRGMTRLIKETLMSPQRVIQSLSDADAKLYYRFYIGTKVGDKYLCVVVKTIKQDAFILTAYLTDSIKKGEIIWLRK